MIDSLRMLARARRGLLAVAAAAVVTAVCAGAPIVASADSPTPLMAGSNFGSADSFQGPHDWYFLVKPGTFDLEIHSMGDGHDTVPLNSAFTYKLSFSPKMVPKPYTFKQDGSGFSFHGTVKHGAKVTVHIIPATSGLVRVARNYAIEASGSAVAFVSGADPIVGTYMDMAHGHGAAHFNANGTIVFADGTTGSWTVFDPSLRIYTLSFGADHASAKLVPGRGLLDQAGNGNSLFDSAH